MKTVRIQGGLGNQLFCLAFARSLALLAGETVRLDVSSYRGDRFGRTFDLADLAARVGGLALADHPVLGHRLTSALARSMPFSVPGLTVESRRGRQITGLDGLADRGGYFDGYWQDERFIHDPATLRFRVRDFIRAQGPPVRPARVVLHYRTYKEERLTDDRRAPGADYFRAAIGLIAERAGAVEWVELVSDDADLALAMIGDIGCPIVPAPAVGPYRDLAAMVNADALILTNSSFSWWGGFCSDARTVVYPARRRLHHYPQPAGGFVCL